MANPARGEVRVQLEGREYALVFDFNAIAEIEAAFGDRPIEQILFAGAMPRRAIIEAVRAGLARRYRRYTSAQVGRMLSATCEPDPEAYAEIIRAVVRGVMGANGTPQDKIDQLDKALEEETKSASADTDPPRGAPETGAP